MTVCTCVSPENIMTGARTPTTLKTTPATSARSTTRSLRRPKNPVATLHERGGEHGEDEAGERQRHHEEGVPQGVALHRRQVQEVHEPGLVQQQEDAVPDGAADRGWRAGWRGPASWSRRPPCRARRRRRGSRGGRCSPTRRWRTRAWAAGRSGCGAGRSRARRPCSRCCRSRPRGRARRRRRVRRARWPRWPAGPSTRRCVTSPVRLSRIEPSRLLGAWRTSRAGRRAARRAGR